MTRFEKLGAVALAAALLPQAAGAARDPAPGFHRQSLDLPGMPAAVIPADMNGDGRDDLVVLVAYTAWGDVASTEQVQFDDIEGLVEVMNVVSALIDRRELRVYLARSESEGYAAPLPPLELDTSVHALSATDRADGPGGAPLLALTDEGVAAVRLIGEGDSRRLVLEPLFAVRSTLADSGTFYADFEFLQDLDGDGALDLLLPIPPEPLPGDRGNATQRWAIHRGTGTDTGFEPSAAAVLRVPPRTDEDEDEDGDDEGGDREPADQPGTAQAPDHEERGEERADDETGGGKRTSARRAPRQPRVEDVNDDGLPDLLVFKADRGRDPLVFLNRGAASFAEPIEVSLLDPMEDEEIAFIGDLDGDGRATVVSAREIEPPDDAGFKLEIEHAKEPDFSYRVYDLGDGLVPAAEPSYGFAAEGYTFEGDDGDDDSDEEDVEVRLPGGFQDLDGDGRQDLVAITLDFSVVPLIFRALVLGSISLRMDFHPYCQNEDGSFTQVQGLDLSGKFKINIRNVQIKHLSQFEGDFNGDGRADFIQLGRGRKVTIHQGGPGCTYPIEPDRTIKLAKEPKHLGLVRIVDLDANGLSDLYVVQPEKDPKSGETPPVRLDLYLGRSTERTSD